MKSKRRRGLTDLECGPKSPAKNLYIPVHPITSREPLNRAGQNINFLTIH